MMHSQTRPFYATAFFSHAFRPFFLLGSLYAATAVLIWLPAFFGELTLHSAFAPLDWHVHEMLFGYISAVVAGFLFTAIPNWTGRLPLRGPALLGLVAVWLAGRVAVAVSEMTGWLPALIIDCGFLAAVSAAAVREIAAGKNWRNLKVVGLVGLLLAANVAFHLEVKFHGAADTSIRAGIALIVLLVSVIGGRVVPSFTRNWLARENPGRLPIPFSGFDKMVLAASAASLVLWVVRPAGGITAVLLAVAGLLQCVRLSRWAGDRTWRDRLVLVLHIGYGFIALGFLLVAAGAAGLEPASAGMHAWMVGGAGVMTLAIMTRASLGHTGRPLVASHATQVIYAAIAIAALSRIAAVIVPAQSMLLLHVAAAFWAMAFLGFVVCFAPVLFGARPGTRDLRAR